MGKMHVAGDPMGTWEDFEESKRPVLGHLTCLNRLFMPGSATGSADRVEKAKKPKNTVIPVLSLLVKDYEELPETGIPESRPVCGAS